MQEVYPVFEFDIEKAIAAIAYLIEKENGQLDMFLGLKMLYLADKESLIRWGKPITGDAFVSLPKGPVLSELYDLFKGMDRHRDNQEKWDSFISEKVNHSIHLLRDVDVGVLSEREKKVLEIARDKINSFAPWDVADWLHETCPEWEDPNGSSLPIDPHLILKNAGVTDEQISASDYSNRYFQQTKKLLGIT